MQKNIFIYEKLRCIYNFTDILFFRSHHVKKRRFISILIFYTFFHVHCFIPHLYTHFFFTDLLHVRLSSRYIQRLLDGSLNSSFYNIHIPIILLRFIALLFNFFNIKTSST